MKYYQKEKSKLGNAPGTIINWSKAVTNSDPNSAQNIRDLPGGYLPCDGQVYSADQYPQLARVLGTGPACIYKKETTTLSDAQFQVPDMGSKHIEASSSGNVGITRNMEKVTGSGENAVTVKRAGVGVEIVSNIGTTATIGFNGVFTIPVQNFALNGNIGWTTPTQTESDYVPANAIGPHMHRATTSYITIKDEPSITSRSQPSYNRAADSNVTALYSQSDCIGRAIEFYQAQNPNITGKPNCSGCTTWDRYFPGYANASGITATGTNTYKSLWPDTLQTTSITAASWPNNVTIPVGHAVPYDTRKETSDLTYPAARNLFETTESPPGTDTTDLSIHSHRIEREIGTTDYNATTHVTTMRPDGLTANVNIRTTNVVKFDDVVSPYFVLEFLIKY